jgi:hypothetical protein
LKKNLLHVTYDPTKVGSEQMLKAIDKQEFDGEVIPDEGRGSAP